MDDAESTLESADDITAAETAPSPKNETTSGVKWCITRGRTMLDSPLAAGEDPSYISP